MCHFSQQGSIPALFRSPGIIGNYVITDFDLMKILFNSKDLSHRPTLGDGLAYLQLQGKCDAGLIFLHYNVQIFHTCI